MAQNFRALQLIFFSIALLLSAYATTYEVVEGTAPATCGDNICQTGETCINCAGDCGACPITPPTDTGATGGTTGRTSGTGDSGQGNGGAGGGTAPTATVTDLNFLPAQAGREATISALVFNGLGSAQKFIVDLNVLKGNHVEFSDSFTTSLIGSGKKYSLNFSHKWTPSTEGEYKAKYTLYSNNKATKYESKEITVKIAGTNENAGGSGTQQPGKNTPGNENTPNANASASPTNTGTETNTPQPTGIDYTLITAGILGLILATIVGRMLIKGLI
ncbi:Uncharacterised protein [uncultured archaeon]|nr:Uncharacterised protein [uncultured archaeon]